MSVSDDDLLARVYSMTDDDDAEIQRMRALRTALRSMPDEEPPEHGLAALMAAARAKADDMKPAPVPWWQRLGAMLRQPSVLAMASVVVLVGGAVLIGRRGDDAATAPAPAATAPEAPGKSAMSAEPRVRDDEKVEKKAGAKAPEESRVPDPKPPARPRPPTGPTVEHSHHVTATPPPPPPPPPPPTNVDGRGFHDQGRGGETIEAPALSDHAATPRLDAQLKESKDKGTDESKPAEPPKPDAHAETEAPVTGAIPPGQRFGGVGQLLRECQTAAGRGDCAAAKAIAARIEKQDSTFYRERVVRDAAVAKCLK